MTTAHPPIILASASPRRSQLLRRMGVTFTVIPAEVDETLRPGAAPADEALRLAVAKAEAVAAEVGPAVVIAADTLCAAGGEILGKPRDRAHARRMLRRLSGTRHFVITGLCVLDTATGPRVAEAVTTAVTMRPMTDEQIAAYVASGEADGKAGAYAIQETGDRYVERLEGSFDNVVGLPTERLGEILAAWGSCGRWR
jgi:septum formation protein